jgi:hypothetical protein
MHARPRGLVLPVLVALATLFSLSTASSSTAPHVTASAPFMIITDASLATAFAPLAAAHTAAGLVTEVHTVQDIVAAYPAAADDAERIRKFLIDAHANRGTKFALMAGDDPLVPIRRVLVREPPGNGLSDIELPTDQYYACLAGTWNDDGDAEWGELPNPSLGEVGDGVSVLPDLAVGRAPVHTVAEAQAFVAKSTAALAVQDGARPIAVLLAANDVYLGPMETIDNAEFTETLLPILGAHPGTQVTRLYQNFASWPGSFAENRESLLDSLDHGYDVAVLAGPGGPGQFEAGAYPADLVNAVEFGARTNAVPAFAIFTSAFTTQPGPGSVGAAWMNDAAGGATAVIGATDIQFLSLTNTYAREFLHQAFELHVPTQGEALAAAVTTLMGQYQLTETTRLTTEGNLLLGDPALAWPGSLEGGATPTLLSLVDSGTGEGVAHISWYASGVAATGATVERRQDGTDWQALGAPTDRGDGLLTYEDHIAGGGRFDYRLRLASGETSAEVWLVIPGVAALRLAGFAPNPSLGPMRVAFTLPNATPATLELVDVAGRQVARRDVGALGAGAHTVDLSDAARVAPGVYWIRLTQGARTLVTRGVRLR